MAGGRSYRTRSSLLVVQIGLAVVLLVAAGLVVRSFNALQNLDLGFTREAVLRHEGRAARAIAAGATRGSTSCCRRSRRCREVEAAGAVYLTPMELGSIGQGTWAIAEGQPESPQTASSNPIVNYLSATPDYFKAMGIPLRARPAVHGGGSRQRAARGADQREHRGGILPRAGSDRQADQGRRRSTPTSAIPDGVWRTIVGVVGNVRYKGLHEVQLDMYDPPAQSHGRHDHEPRRADEARRRKRNALAVAAAIQTQARQHDPRALVSGITMLDDVVNKEIAPWRFSAWVFALFAALAFALSMLGLVQPGEPRRREPPARVRDSHGGRRHRRPHCPWRVSIGGRRAALGSPAAAARGGSDAEA